MEERIDDVIIKLLNLAKELEVCRKHEGNRKATFKAELVIDYEEKIEGMPFFHEVTCKLEMENAKLLKENLELRNKSKNGEYVMLSKREFGMLLKKARKIHSKKLGFKYTQQMLGSALGISQSYIGDIESGRIYPNYVLLNKFADIFGADLIFQQKKQ